MLTKARTLMLALAVALVAAVPAVALAKHGADDPPGDDRGGSRVERDDDGSGRRGGDDDSSGSRRGGRDDGRRIVTRSCTDGARVELKVKRDDGRLEVELEVDQNRSGVTWRVGIRRNRALVVRTRATTGGRSGSFSVERKIADPAGRDRIAGRAVSPSGEVCRAALTF